MTNQFNLIGLAGIIATRLRKLRGVDDTTPPFYEKDECKFKIIGTSGEMILVSLSFYRPARSDKVPTRVVGHREARYPGKSLDRREVVERTDKPMWRHGDDS